MHEACTEIGLGMSCLAKACGVTTKTQIGVSWLKQVLFEFITPR